MNTLKTNQTENTCQIGLLQAIETIFLKSSIKRCAPCDCLIMALSEFSQSQQCLQNLLKCVRMKSVALINVDKIDQEENGKDDCQLNVNFGLQ